MNLPASQRCVPVEAVARSLHCKIMRLSISHSWRSNWEKKYTVEIAWLCRDEWSSGL